jgi:hypothetical protein
MSASARFKLLAFTATAVLAARAHVRVLAARRKQQARAQATTLDAEQEKTGQPPEAVALYAAIGRHDGFTREGARRAFAHLGQKEIA